MTSKVSHHFSRGKALITIFDLTSKQTACGGPNSAPRCKKVNFGNIVGPHTNNKMTSNKNFRIYDTYSDAITHIRTSINFEPLRGANVFLGGCPVIKPVYEFENINSAVVRERKLDG